ncbi:hypothetical protein Cal7507_1793 [Calothrix sp. PCC 7507]|nr:hypothetical protein Cal7507_1793 [Calothrix sp. PCC 7507]
MLNLTQGITVRTEHVFLLQQNVKESGDLRDWGLGTGLLVISPPAPIRLRSRQACPLPPYGSTQRPSALIRSINSSTPWSSGTFLISSLPRYKEI